MTWLGDRPRSPLRGRLRRRRRRPGPGGPRLRDLARRAVGLRRPLGPRRPHHARRRGVPRRLRPARRRDLAAPALPGPGPGRDVAAGDRARLAPGRGRAAAARAGSRSAWSRSGSCCSRSAPASPARCRRRTPFVVALWVGVAALALASIGGRHLPGAAARAAGRSRVRRLGDLGPRHRDARRRAVVVLAALAVPSFSLVAFWLYSLGMHRAAVPSTTAALIVAQTFVPAAVGVALLGDGVRDGWWPAVVARAAALDRRRRRARAGPVRSRASPARR